VVKKNPTETITNRKRGGLENSPYSKGMQWYVANIIVKTGKDGNSFDHLYINYMEENRLNEPKINLPERPVFQLEWNATAYLYTRTTKTC
jgi:hypothetical protein